MGALRQVGSVGIPLACELNGELARSFQSSHKEQLTARFLCRTRQETDRQRASRYFITETCSKSDDSRVRRERRRRRPREGTLVWLAMYKHDDVKPSRGPISLLSFLEAENAKLRQAVAKLSLDARALREALKRMETHDRGVDFRSSKTASTPRRPYRRTRS